MKIGTHLVAVCINCLIPSAAVLSQAPADASQTTLTANAELESELASILERHQLPALWAGKFHYDGRQVMACSGIRAWGSQAKVAIDDQLHIGSCTKAMTAVIVAQCISGGLFDFETCLGDLFPDEETLRDSSWATVSVRELLEHRSGAPANANWTELDREHPQDQVAARRQMLRWLVQRSRPRKARHLYSNVGYALLGHIVETSVDEPWESLMRKRLFEPLQISSGGFGPVGPAMESGDDRRQTTFAWGHVRERSLTGLLGSLLGTQDEPAYQPVQIDNSPPLGPAGRVHLNLWDWSQFGTACVDPQGYQRLQVSAEVSRELITTENQEDAYAGGWVLLERDWAEGPVLFHNGSNTTWYCVVFAAPKKGFCLLAATNAYSDAAMKACDEAVQAALKAEWSNAP
ncbi:MAG: beta-lactamase family protein [bacterium]|nr:beta-lactamase family protein [bacterium]